MYGDPAIVLRDGKDIMDIIGAGDRKTSTGMTASLQC